VTGPLLRPLDIVTGPLLRPLDSMTGPLLRPLDIMTGPLLRPPSCFWSQIDNLIRFIGLAIKTDWIFTLLFVGPEVGLIS